MAKLDTLQNKVVWITGASSGLGKALAGEFALQGAQVILTSRRFEELEEVRVGLLHPDQHLSVVADITNQEQVQEAYEQILKAKGRIDWLINNAGLSQRAFDSRHHNGNRTGHYGSRLFLTSRINQNCVTDHA